MLAARSVISRGFTLAAIAAPLVSCQHEAPPSGAQPVASTSASVATVAAAVSAPAVPNVPPAASASSAPSSSAKAAEVPTFPWVVGAGKVTTAPQLIATELDFDSVTGNIRPKSKQVTPVAGFVFCIADVTVTNPLGKGVTFSGASVHLRYPTGEEVGFLSKVSGQPQDTPYMPGEASGLPLGPHETKTETYLFSVKKGTKELLIHNGSGAPTRLPCAG